MKSITHGEVSYDKMCRLIKNYIIEDKNKHFNITVGTDSQNFDITKVVVVVAVWKVGWVKACGFECKTKPDSYAASSIVNRYSK